MSLYIEERVSLAPHTTFGIGGPAELFAAVTSETELVEALEWADAGMQRVTVLSGGSNVLIADEGIRGLVVKNEIEGIAFRDAPDNPDAVLATAGAGVLFDSLVKASVARGLYGLENLSAIPGSVGATPIQNVGAYGVEVADCIEEVRIYDRTGRRFETLSNATCTFGYRDSIFKHEKGRSYVVTAVTYRLSKRPALNLSYRDLAERFADRAPSLQEVRDAIAEIRALKFPDWHKTGTAGSFFKNPIVSGERYEALRRMHPELPGFPLPGGNIKIPLGWILDKLLGFRGAREGNVGTYAGQALVVVNCGGATAEEVRRFAEKISEAVAKETGIMIEWEVTYKK